jgi:GMP synthase (glutamine-hydrolysing)
VKHLHRDQQPITVILHHDFTDVSWLSRILENRRTSPDWIRPYRGDSLPDPLSSAGVISMGGPQHAYEHHRGHYLDAEESFLSGAVDAGVPVLGICLGSQILANVLGGRALLAADGDECGPLPIDIEDNSEDGVLAGQSGVYFSMHEDTFELPPGAQLLACSDRYPQAFRLGTAIGIQFHPEMSPRGVAAFAAALPERFRACGHEPDAVVAWAQKQKSFLQRRAETILGRWIELEARKPGAQVYGAR